MCNALSRNPSSNRIWPTHLRSISPCCAAPLLEMEEPMPRPCLSYSFLLLFVLRFSSFYRAYPVLLPLSPKRTRTILVGTTPYMYSFTNNNSSTICFRVPNDRALHAPFRVARTCSSATSWGAAAHDACVDYIRPPASGN